MIRRRMENGRYVLDRRKKEEDERFELFGSILCYLGQETTATKETLGDKSPHQSDQRVLHPHGVHWELFRDDVFAMCDAAVGTNEPGR